jgi:hypothetical protein
MASPYCTGKTQNHCARTFLKSSPFSLRERSILLVNYMFSLLDARKVLELLAAGSVEENIVLTKGTRQA